MRFLTQDVHNASNLHLYCSWSVIEVLRFFSKVYLIVSFLTSRDKIDKIGKLVYTDHFDRFLGSIFCKIKLFLDPLIEWRSSIRVLFSEPLRECARRRPRVTGLFSAATVICDSLFDKGDTMRALASRGFDFLPLRKFNSRSCYRKKDQKLFLFNN